MAVRILSALWRYLAAVLGGAATGSAGLAAVVIGPNPVILYDIFPWLLILAIALCAAALLLYGIPVMLVLRYAGAESLGAYLSCGAVGGFLITALLLLGEGPRGSVAELFGAAYGVSTAGWFWLLFSRRRRAA